MSITSTTNAMLLMDANGVNPFKTTQYPDLSQGWWNSAVAPKTQDYSGYNFQKYGTQAPTFQTYSEAAPTYTGLSDGAYGRLEKSLANPGAIAARNAYQQNKVDATAAAGGKGTYGSSPYMTQLTSQIGKNYADTMSTNASNAAAQRYSMQQKDLQFGTSTALDAWKQKLAENIAANSQGMQGWLARLNENNIAGQLGQSDAQFGANYNYRNALTDSNFQNSLKQALWSALTDKANFDSGQVSSVFNRAMNWGQNTDELSDALKSQTISKMSQQGNSSGIGGLLGGIGSVAGSILGGPLGGTLGGTLGNLFSSSSYIPSAIEGVNLSGSGIGQGLGSFNFSGF